MTSLPLVIIAFLVAAAVVWWAGTRLPRYVVAVSDRTGIGHAFAGMLLLGGITSLPELSAATSAAAMGASSLALNNILGSVAFNILLLAIADMALGNRPLTSVVAKPVTLIQGVLGMMLLAVVILAMTTGDTALFDMVGIWSVVILLLVLVAIGIADRAERRPMWLVVNPPDLALAAEAEGDELSIRELVLGLVGLAALIMGAGGALAYTGDIIAERSGLGGSLVGLLFAAAATSLPELSAITGAMRHQRYELAVGEIFGSNLFNLGIIFAIDVAAPGPPVLGEAGSFEIAAALLALVLTGIFVLGLIERRDRTLFRMGEDSIAAIFVYGLGIVFLVGLAGRL